jgi:phospholipase/carboxylesterase
MTSLSYVVKQPHGRADTDGLPMVVLLHGRGADANDLADLAPLLFESGGDYRVIFPNAPKPFSPMPGYSFGFTWFDGWPAERSSFLNSRKLLLELLDEVAAKYPTPKGKLVLGGFSQGGLMSIDVGFRTQQELAGLVVMSGAMFEDDLPTFRSDLPVLIAHGTADEVIPVLAARRMRLVLGEKGVEAEYHEYPMGHAISPESLAVVGEFIKRVLSAES